MKILMTGITGFIGHHLGERLVNDGHEVFAIVRPTSKIDGLSENLRHNVKFHVYDSENTVLDIVTDLCVEGNRPDVVYHLAANFLNAHQFDDIKFLIQSNITFGTELLDAMAANNIFNFVNTGAFRGRRIQPRQSLRGNQGMFREHYQILRRGARLALYRAAFV